MECLYLTANTISNMLSTPKTDIRSVAISKMLRSMMRSRIFGLRNRCRSSRVCSGLSISYLCTSGKKRTSSSPVNQKKAVQRIDTKTLSKAVSLATVVDLTTNSQEPPKWRNNTTSVVAGTMRFIAISALCATTNY
jgi:hypothetical protein